MMGSPIARIRSATGRVLREARRRSNDIGRQYLARLRRSTLPGVTFIGITGSAGKTTTKTLSELILSTKGKCRSSGGAGNEHYDVEWTVLRTNRRHAFSIVEVSASRPGYLDRSLRALRPQIGVLTLIAREHYSAFRSNEAIAAEKGKLISALPPDGVAVLNRDDPHVRAIGERHAGRVIWVGRDEGATIRLLDVHSRWPTPLTLHVRFEHDDYEVRTQLHGTQLALPVLCALGVAVAAGVRFRDAVAALSLAKPVQGRMQIESSDDGVVFVRDDWKAPQWSFQAPLEFLRDAEAPRKVAVIGTISDSPRSPAKRYGVAVEQALEVADLVVLVGVDARDALKVGARRGEGLVHAFAQIRDAAQFLRSELRAGDLVLLKGTHKQDHLVRLLLDRNRAVQCWRPACGRNVFCGSCPLLYSPPAGGELPAGEEEPVDAAKLPTAPASCSTPLVVGLGNPGARHRDTPHNVGYRTIEALARKHGGTWAEQAEGMASTIELDGAEVTLLKPGASMNLSGPMVQRFIARSGRSLRDCILIHDDMDLELGTMREKRSGGDGGHKGVRSVIAALGGDEFVRLRIGVRPRGDTRKSNELVLSKMSATDESALTAAVERAEDAVRRLVAERSKRSAVTADEATLVSTDEQG